MQKKHDGEQETSSLSHNNPLIMTPTNNGRGMTPTPTPTSERRQRKTLLIQKQRINYIQQQNSLNIPNMNNNNSNGNSINNGSSSSIRSILSSSRSLQHPVDCDISESSNRSLPSVSSTTNTNPTSTSTPMTMANRILFRRSSTQHNQQSAASIRIKRFIHIMLMVAVFCLLGLLREQTVNGSNQRFRMGTIDEVKHQSADDDGHLLKKKAQRKKELENLVQMPHQQQPDTPMTSLHQQPDMPMTALHPQDKDGEGNLAMHQKEAKELQQPQQSNAIPTRTETTTTVATSDSLTAADTTITDHTETDATTGTSGSNNADSTPKTSKPATTSTNPRKRNQNKPILQKLPKAYPRAPYDSSMKLQPPNLPEDTSNNHTFVRQYCDLQGTDWFPQHNNKHTTSTNNATNEWHQRAPFILLLGPDHGGSDMLYQLLSTHPQMADALQSQFFTFNAKKFAKQTNAAASADGSSSTTTKVRIRTRAARRAYMARHVRTQRQLQSNPSQIVLDNVPETLLYEHVMAPLILCAMPWVKLVLVVKHPLQRLLQQYKAAQQRGLSLSLEHWIARDLERMQQAGLLVAPPGSSATANIDEQQRQAALEAITNRQAWERYQQQTHTAWEASVGQSLYEAMVQPWFQWMSDAGRNPQTEIVVVQYEVFTSSKNNENAVEKEYASLLRQLGLAPHTPPAPLMESIQKQAARERETWKTEFGDDKVRKQLKHFFQPYNKLFDEFLQQTYGTATISGAEDDERLLRWKPGLWKSG